MPPELGASETALLAFITGRETRRPTDLVVSDARASASERLEVYAHMYRARLVETLEAVYPRLARHLGHEAFHAIAAGYMAAHPSRHPSLRFFGASLAAWLDEHEPKAPWLGDLARLEWARSDVFDGVDEPLLELEALRTLSPDAFVGLPLRLVSAHAFVLVDHDTAGFWDGGEPAGEPEDPHGQTLLVWRQEAAVYHRALSATEAAVLERVAFGTTLGAVCERLAGTLSTEEATAQAFAWLSTWVQDGLLVA